MQKQLPIIIGALVIIALVGVVAFTQLNKSSKTAKETATGQETAKSDESLTKGTIKSLLGMGKNVSCTVNYTGTDQMGTNGTVYVSGKKMRGDFMVKGPDNKETDSHMITDETYSYFWSGAMPQGTKMKIDQAEKVSPAPGASSAQNQAAELDKQVDYKCSPWSVDNSKFTPPSNITFTDISAMMNQNKQMMQQSPSSGSQQSACDAITDPTAKAACVKATSGY